MEILQTDFFLSLFYLFRGMMYRADVGCRGKSGIADQPSMNDRERKGLEERSSVLEDQVKREAEEIVDWSTESISWLGLDEGD
jgi:hypothetical protein